MYWNTFKVGIKNLMLRKLRSLLTVLGVILGVGSVIAMLAIGEGSKREALEQIRRLGANNVIIRSVKPTAGEGEDSTSATQQQTSFILEYGLKYKDFERLTATLPTVTDAVPIAMVRKHARREHRWIPNARILATTPKYLRIKNMKLARGRFVTAVDDWNTRNVAVLGAGAAERLFSYKDPLGQSVLLGDDVYRIVGILTSQASASATPLAAGQPNANNEIYIPLSCAQRRFGEFQSVQSTGSRSYEKTQLHEITLKVGDEQLVSQTAGMARKILLRTHPREDDFQLTIPLELLRRAEEEKRIWNLVLGSIAGISLVVGGIGIMNIMLANVTERTREIGIRRAIGAKRWDITVQFLIETVLLSSVGGTLGVILGVTIPVVVSYLADIDTVLSWWAILLAFGISVGIGIVFGIYPARRAALMDPIEALRHE
ncbi:MAG: ABC transporter permease [Pirellulaceae bacterium]